MFKRAVGGLFFVFIVFFIFVSCGNNQSTGLIGVGKIKLTETPTPTPDVNFTVYIHQETTPVQNVVLIMHDPADLTITTSTGISGTAGFEINSAGPWNLEVDVFDGFKSQYFAVDPISNTFYAKNYGIPSLELELVSGSENIPIFPNMLEYKLIYHTKFERKEDIVLDTTTNIQKNYSDPNFVTNEGDTVFCVLNIPKSYEGYNVNYKYLSISAHCYDENGDNTYSNQRTLTKDWTFNVSIGLHYMQVYAYDDNARQISYYAGISSLFAGNSFNIPFVGDVTCKIINAKNTGTDGTGVYTDAGACTPWYTNFGCFQTLAKIKTSASLYNDNLRDDNAGEVNVWFHDSDGGYLSVTRTFKTQNDWLWGATCAWWCCTSAPNTGVSRVVEACKVGLKMPCGACIYPWDKPTTADIKRKKSGTINITY